jgi:hypothetical protein
MHSNIRIRKKKKTSKFRKCITNKILPPQVPLQAGPKAQRSFCSARPKVPDLMLHCYSMRSEDSEPQSSACLYLSPQKLVGTKGCDLTMLIMPYKHQQAHQHQALPKRKQHSRYTQKFSKPPGYTQIHFSSFYCLHCMPSSTPSIW